MTHKNEEEEKAKEVGREKLGKEVGRKEPEGMGATGQKRGLVVPVSRDLRVLCFSGKIHTLQLVLRFYHYVL